MNGEPIEWIAKWSKLWVGSYRLLRFLVCGTVVSLVLSLLASPIFAASTQPWGASLVLVNAMICVVVSYKVMRFDRPMAQTVAERGAAALGVQRLILGQHFAAASAVVLATAYVSEPRPLVATVVGFIVLLCVIADYARSRSLARARTWMR